MKKEKTLISNKTKLGIAVGSVVVLSVIASIIARKRLEKEKRIAKSTLKDLVEAYTKEIEEIQISDNARRLQYRERLIKENEEIKAYELQKANEMAAALEGNDDDAKKKKGKK